MNQARAVGAAEWNAVELGAAGVGVVLSALWLSFGPPLADALASGVPGAGGEALFTLIVFVPMLVLALAGAWVAGLFACRPGHRPFIDSAMGLALGLGGVLIAAGYAAIAGTLSVGDAGEWGGTLLVGVAVIAVQVLAEEALFRGWLQPLAARIIGGVAAVLVVASAFAGFHLLGGAQGIVTIVNLFLGGLLFGLLAMRGGGIAGAFAAHFGWNAGEQLLLGLDPNPGVGGFGTLFDLDLAGLPLWGGSEAGLNGSLAMTFALAAIVAALAVAGFFRPMTKPKRA